MEDFVAPTSLLDRLLSWIIRRKSSHSQGFSKLSVELGRYTPPRLTLQGSALCEGSVDGKLFVFAAVAWQAGPAGVRRQVLPGRPRRQLLARLCVTPSGHDRDLYRRWQRHQQGPRRRAAAEVLHARRPPGHGRGGFRPRSLARSSPADRCRDGRASNEALLLLFRVDAIAVEADADAGRGHRDRDGRTASVHGHAEDVGQNQRFPRQGRGRDEDRSTPSQAE